MSDEIRRLRDRVTHLEAAIQCVIDAYGDQGWAKSEMCRYLRKALQSLPALPPDDPPLTDDDNARLLAIQETKNDHVRRRLIYVYWHDQDRADRTPRGFLYLHMGILDGTLDRLLATLPTFEITALRGTRPAITCRFCEHISLHPRDVEHRYCGTCHLFHDAVMQGRAQLSAGGTHDCGEWRTYRGACALCGEDLTRHDDPVTHN